MFLIFGANFHKLLVKAELDQVLCEEFTEAMHRNLNNENKSKCGYTYHSLICIFFLSIPEKDPKGNSLTPVSILEYDE